MEDSWENVSDATLRKRIQNRLAQRKHRQKSQKRAGAQDDLAQGAAFAVPNYAWDFADFDGEQSAAQQGGCAPQQWEAHPHAHGIRNIVHGDSDIGVTAEAGECVAIPGSSQDDGSTGFLNMSSYDTGGIAPPAAIRPGQHPTVDMMTAPENGRPPDPSHHQRLQQHRSLMAQPDSSSAPATLAAASQTTP
ncbi:uncharacterized protein PG986_002326 [Apiospora aurea]|uniref:BZIP domain-containing protein n=1 Tax=Apiospora aurea TaxID=335848 RepID=A0ABR1QZJ5_9PEZI